MSKYSYELVIKLNLDALSGEDFSHTKEVNNKVADHLTELAEMFRDFGGYRRDIKDVNGSDIITSRVSRHLKK